jgi:phage tail protein X
MTPDNLCELDDVKLQRFCKEGPDTAFDELGLSLLQWKSCFEEGPGRHAKMVGNIERVFAANQALADLPYQEIETLQKFCRQGPDAPFDKLGVLPEQWKNCLEEGPQCHAKMIKKINHFYLANQTLAAVCKLEAASLEQLCRKGPDDTFCDLGLLLNQWRSCFEEGPGRHAKMVGNIKRVFAANQALADLPYQEIETLQKFCRQRPDAPFDKLDVLPEQWKNCLEEGPECHAKMIENINKFYLANQTLAALPKQEARSLQEFCRIDCKNNLFEDLGLSPQQWVSCFEEDPLRHEDIVKNIKRLIAANQTLAVLPKVPLPVLQSLCVDGPSALGPHDFFDNSFGKLGLSLEDWRSCFEEGPGRHAKMVGNIERVFAANQALAALPKLEKLTL